MNDVEPAPTTTPAAGSQSAVLRRLFLTLFLRGRSSRGLRRERSPKNLAQKLWFTLGAYALAGVFALVLVHQPVFSFSILLHAMTFVFLGLSISASAGEMLFNKEEADILLHRPVAPRSLLWAKVSVLVEISLWLAGAFNLVGTLAGAAAKGGGWLFLPVHALSTALEALFCTGFVVITYQLCLRWCGRERLEALMTTAQVVLATTAVLAGQIVPRLLIDITGRSQLGLDRWWLGLLPPVWFACLDELLTGHVETAKVLLAALGLGMTALILALAFTRLARDYEVGMQSLNETVGLRSRKAARAREGGEPRRLLDRLVGAPPLSWWLRDPVERASFLLCAAYLVRDREVKLRIYPAVAPVAIMPFFMLLPAGRRTGADIGDFGIAFVGFVVAVVPMLALSLLRYSQQWQATDLFRVTPIGGPGRLAHGARRAVLVFLALPVLVCAALVVLLLRGDPAHLLLLLPGVICLPVYAMISSGGADGVPLSQPSEEARSVGRGLKVIGAMSGSALLAGLAALARANGLFTLFVAVEAAIAVAVFVISRRALDRAVWSRID